MKKEKEYKRWISGDIIKKAVSSFVSLSEQEGRRACKYRVSSDAESWSYDIEKDFYAAYSKDVADAKYSIKVGDYSIYISYSKELYATKVAVSSPSREEIEDIFAIFEESAKA